MEWRVIVGAVCGIAFEEGLVEQSVYYFICNHCASVVLLLKWLGIEAGNGTYSFPVELLRDKCDFPTQSWYHLITRQQLLRMLSAQGLRLKGQRCCDGRLLLIVLQVMRPSE